MERILQNPFGILLETIVFILFLWVGFYCKILYIDMKGNFFSTSLIMNYFIINFFFVFRSFKKNLWQSYCCSSSLLFYSWKGTEYFLVFFIKWYLKKVWMKLKENLYWNFLYYSNKEVEQTSKAPFFTLVLIEIIESLLSMILL